MSNTMQKGRSLFYAVCAALVVGCVQAKTEVVSRGQTVATQDAPAKQKAVSKNKKVAANDQKAVAKDQKVVTESQKVASNDKTAVVKEAPVEQKTVSVAPVKKQDTKVATRDYGFAPKDQKIGAVNEEGELFLDGVATVVFGQEGTQVITKSEVVRPNLAGAVRSLDDIVFERLLYLDACKHKSMTDDDAVDKYLAIIQRQNNLTGDQMRHVFASAGYTYDEGREQFKIMHAANQMMDHKVRSGVIVPRKEVEKYYDEHPQVDEAVYTLQRAFVPFDPSQEREQQRAQLAIDVPKGRGVTGIEWSSTFKLGASDVALSKDFIHTMKLSEMSEPIEITDGFEIYRLVTRRDEKVRTMEERYAEIVDHLRMPRYQELLDEYRSQLFGGASILNFELTLG